MALVLVGAGKLKNAWDVVTAITGVAERETRIDVVGLEAGAREALGGAMMAISSQKLYLQAAHVSTVSAVTGQLDAIGLDLRRGDGPSELRVQCEGAIEARTWHGQTVAEVVSRTTGRLKFSDSIALSGAGAMIPIVIKAALRTEVVARENVAIVSVGVGATKDPTTQKAKSTISICLAKRKERLPGMGDYFAPFMNEINQSLKPG